MRPTPPCCTLSVSEVNKCHEIRCEYEVLVACRVQQIVLLASIMAVYFRGGGNLIKPLSPLARGLIINSYNAM